MFSCSLLFSVSFFCGPAMKKNNNNRNKYCAKWILSIFARDENRPENFFSLLSFVLFVYVDESVPKSRTDNVTLPVLSPRMTHHLRRRVICMNFFSCRVNSTCIIMKGISGCVTWKKFFADLGEKFRVDPISWDKKKRFRGAKLSTAHMRTAIRKCLHFFVFVWFFYCSFTVIRSSEKPSFSFK